MEIFRRDDTEILLFYVKKKECYVAFYNNFYVHNDKKKKKKCMHAFSPVDVLYLFPRSCQVIRRRTNSGKSRNVREYQFSRTYIYLYRHYCKKREDYVLYDKNLILLLCTILIVKKNQSTLIIYFIFFFFFFVNYEKFAVILFIRLRDKRYI
ncbi:hypothetical protein PUN28_009332 [Cardiocondyla obscurior]|uniref:Uncharacterized protein n=1 Tax=Cardiocondyla obscurior TaxID=286306 RepID=A0AAW2FUU8_9HYME